jgi:NAD(P)-dependent dehydrogenase (short-subunit alcohol dehydrogenase family)
MELAERVVLIAGGGRGIGRAIALACAAQGARVGICARTGPDLEETHRELSRRSGQRALAVQADVTDAGDVGRLVERSERELGPIWGLVCAAGVLGTIGPFGESRFEDWERTIEINLLGAARCAHAVVPGMKKRGAGRIVFFSGGGQGAQARRTAYVASKGAIWRLTESLGAELAPAGVLVNAIAPGAVNTRLLEEVLAAGPTGVGGAEYESALRQEMSGGNSPDKAAALCVFLLSDRSHGLYGKVLSAVWDDWTSWTDLDAISRSDLYTMKRVTSSDGGTR